MFGYSLLLLALSKGMTSHVTKVSFVGNSIIYYNDTPNVITSCTSEEVTTSCCMRGGASLISLKERGSNMKRVFKEGSDYGAEKCEELFDGGDRWVVMNDFTQSPARENTRTNTLQVLEEYYGPSVLRMNEDATVVFLETFAYVEEGVNGSEDLGTFEEVREGDGERSETQEGWQEKHATCRYNDSSLQ